jgi:hypothetical protein
VSPLCAVSVSPCRPQAMAAKAAVPPAIVDEFVWRRQRNFNVTAALVQQMATDATLQSARLYITLDDNAEYGFNIAEAAALRSLVQQLGLQQRVLVYPGADEVGLTLLARAAVDMTGYQPSFHVVFRNASTVNLIPNFEGQPMIQTLYDQASAAGAVLVTDTNGTQTLDAELLVNNFSEFPQLEAPSQPMTGRSIGDYALFTSWACNAVAAKRPIGFLDNRYSNGADVIFVQYLGSLVGKCSLAMESFAYAGWNTDGNTIGTVISNLVLLALQARDGAPGASQASEREKEEIDWAMKMSRTCSLHRTHSTQHAAHARQTGANKDTISQRKTRRQTRTVAPSVIDKEKDRHDQSRTCTHTLVALTHTCEQPMLRSRTRTLIFGASSRTITGRLFCDRRSYRMLLRCAEMHTRSSVFALIPHAGRRRLG